MGLIFFVLFVVAGFKWMTAAGNEEAIESAKHIMTAAVVGLIITLLAWGLSFWVLSQLREKEVV
jgi:heme/copper-type cytochrome/quinol oxidase subunit 2